MVKTYHEQQFFFPNSDHMIFAGEWAFVFSLVMHTLCMLIAKLLEETVTRGNITRSAMAKQSIRAKHVYSKNQGKKRLQ